MFSLRAYQPADPPALLALFRDTIRHINSRDYDADQIRAWASDDIDPAHWAERFRGRFVPVAETDGRPVGFAELEANGHIDRFYVSADHQRQGIGRGLMDALVTEARRPRLARLFPGSSQAMIGRWNRYRAYEMRPTPTRTADSRSVLPSRDGADTN